jgi:phosphoserine phosphatase RsbU/P
LIVDDNPSNLQVLANSVKQTGLKLTVAMNGRQAIAITRKRKPDLILMDVNMPEMDGFEACSILKKDTETASIPIIFLTARTATEDIVKGFELGGVDYILKPFNSVELIARITTHISLVESRRKLEEAYLELKTDLEYASKIQQSLLPKNNIKIDNFVFNYLFIPSVYVSGDTFNYFSIDDKYICFYVVDVAGHGIPSSYLSVQISRLLTGEINPENPLFKYQNGEYILKSPVEVAGDLNIKFQSTADSMEYFTMIYGIIDIKNESIEITQAGHPIPVLLKENKAELIQSDGFPIGLVPFAEYDSIKFDFKSNTKLILYSDGVTECENDKKELFTHKQLIDFIEKNTELNTTELLNEIMQQLNNWHGNNKYNDDISILVIENKSVNNH